MTTVSRFALVLLLAAVAACGTVTKTVAAADPGAALAAVEVAPGVYMLPGAPGEPDAGNRGRIGNAGFIVGPTGVIAVDTGTSFRHGAALLAAIASVTDRPVRLALVTHTRQEFLFGGAAFRQHGIPVAMHEAAAALMASRCENCLKTMRRELGEEEMRGTTMYVPDRSFDAGHGIELIGRPVRVLYFGHASGPGDIAVFDVQTGVLFAGGLLDHRRIPDVADSRLPGWRHALAELRGLGVKVVVAGHGPVATAQAIDDVERYLNALESRVRRLIQIDSPLSEVADAASLPEFSGWDQYDTVHRRNASIVFLRLEREQLFR